MKKVPVRDDRDFRISITLQSTDNVCSISFIPGIMQTKNTNRLSLGLFGQILPRHFDHGAG